jgi:membrane-associated phospholipid phosphatase
MKQNWLEDVGRRVRSRWLAKSLGTTAAITAFMIAYFILLRHPQFAVTIIPPTALDRWVTFTPWAVVPYASLWLYISLAPALIAERETAPYLASAGALAFIGLAVFLFFPTAIIEPGINWARYPSVSFLKSLDAAGNACPSLHVAFSVLTALWLHRILMRINAPALARIGNWSWAALIIWSTLAIKQHLAIDMEAGAALGALIGGAGLLVEGRLHASANDECRRPRVMAAAAKRP